MLYVDGARLSDLAFADLPRHVRAGDLMVFNDTRVIKARLFARRPTGGQVELLLERVIKARVFARKSTGGKVEILVERIVGDEAWVQLRASHPPATGSALQLPGAASAVIVARDERFFRLRFEGTGPIDEWLEQHGDVPLPPYITRAPGNDDTTRYQTVYAREPGAVAAPTAGLHFDAAMLAAFAARGVEHAFITLHVGAGTFQPVQTDDLARHRMHSEWYRIPQKTADAIAATRARGGRVPVDGAPAGGLLRPPAVLRPRHRGRGGQGLTRAT